MRPYFAYIRVSTAKQGEHGVSLQEQRDAILRYAERHGLTIVRWFEEQETAAKRGRPVFTTMLRLLRSRRAAGVIIHKIDRSARNLKDWADLGDLIDEGLEVHFANESLDLHSRGGRLSADIQAVVAADYIRNLREETRKGFYGRIKQGYYPLPAPLGYLDQGKAKPKILDPAKAPLVRKAFELYATSRYPLDELVEEIARLGLHNRQGGRVTRAGLSVMLNNPFYIGLIRLRSTGETFPGAHEPLIPKSLFDRVQQVLDGKTVTRAVSHDFVFRRLLNCASCGYSLIGEMQKGRVYYRCHTRTCPGTCVREDLVDGRICDLLAPLGFDEEENQYVQEQLAKLKVDWTEEREKQITALVLQIACLQDRLGRLTDAYLDGVLEKDLFEERKARLLLQRKGLEEALSGIRAGHTSLPNTLADYLELAGAAYLQYETALPAEKRELVRILTSNRRVFGKMLDFTLAEPFSEVANRFQNSNGGPYRNIPRTWDRLLSLLVDQIRRTEESPSDHRELSAS